MRIKNWVLFLTVFAIGTLQITALNYLTICGVMPDLLLITVIFFTFYFGRDTGIKTAVFAGLLKDITSTTVLGSSAFGFFLCVLFLSYFGNNFYKRRFTTQILLCGLAHYFVTFFVVFINHAIAKNQYINLGTYQWIILKASFYTGSVSPILFLILSKVFRSVRFQKKYI
jgi:rod shape-determining protein MreD